MAFFGNDAVNRVNLHTAIQALAMGAGGVFVLVFLLRNGVPTAGVFLVLAAILAGRFVLRPLILPLAKRLGLRILLIAGSLLMALQYPVLASVHGVGAPLIVFIAVGAVGDVFYWPSYHAYFSTVGDDEHRGHQIGAREAISAIIGIGAPLAGAWALGQAGPTETFWAVGVVQALSAAPLIGGPDAPVKDEAPGAFRAAVPGMLLFVADGFFGGAYYYVWTVALFVTVGRSYSAYGGAMALAALAGAVGGLTLGRFVDRGHGARSALFAYGVAAAVVVLRATSLNLPWLAVGANAAGALVVALLMPALMSPVYTLAKASPCPLRFHMAAEGAWDIGCAGAALSAAAIATAGASLGWAILLALPAAAGAIALLLRYYRVRGRAGRLDYGPAA